MKERLQKYMAECGVASRRKCEEIIKSGRVEINGITVNNVVLVDAETDNVKVDGNTIKPAEKKIYIVLNKPTSVITSVHDQFERRTIMDFIDIKERVFPVGRLDYDSSGIIIITNDGELANNIMHPSKKIDKVYIADVFGILSQNDINTFKEGIMLDGTVSSANLKIIGLGKEMSTAEVIIHEGKNRQVRRMFSYIDHEVLRLKRIRIGNVEIGDLKEGQWRYMTSDEINYFKII